MKRIVLAFLVCLVGCSGGGAGPNGPVVTFDLSATDGSAASDMAGGTVPAGEIRGVIRKGAGLTFSGDGKGALWVDIGPSCPYPQPGPNFAVTKSITNPGADLSGAANVSFTMTQAPTGTFALWAWIDDNADANPLPSGGDPGNFPACAMVTLTAAAGANIDVTFDSSTWN